MDKINHIKQLANRLNSSLDLHYQIGIKLGIDLEELRIYDEIREIINSIISKIDSIMEKQPIIVNYMNQIQRHFNNINNQLPYKQNLQIQIETLPNKELYKNNLIKSLSTLKNIFKQFKFDFDLFIKLNFFSGNIVIIGANGSGKTSFANILKNNLDNNGIVISAQRVLRIPNFNAIPNPSQTLNQLKQSQVQDKTAKSEQSYSVLQSEFGIILQHLLADNIARNNEYVKKARECGEKGEEIPKPPTTNLVKTINIWNELIKHRLIDTEDGLNIIVKTSESSSYSAIQMSDGEKVVLYLVAQVLQAPQNGFIVVDEPEMHLHKSILYKLWDRLEKERKDCIFIYLTHDLDFAVSRTTAKKVWIKSYIPPNKFEIEDVPSNEIPENLMIELLGSRKTILFCEGEKGSLDAKIYQLLFPNFTVMPVGSCNSVINYTIAYNKLPNTYSKSVGIIDADFRSQEEIDNLKANNIFVLNFAEIENILLIEDFLKLLGANLLIEDIENVINNIKNKVLRKLDQEKELQASRYVVAKINHYFSKSYIEKANNIEEVENKYKEFIDQVNITEWYSKRIEEINRIVGDKAYLEAIKIFNNKGLRQIVNEEFKIKDFINRAITFLNKSDKGKNILYSVFPQELIEKHLDSE